MKIDTKTAYWILIGGVALVTLGITLNLNRELDRTNGLLAESAKLPEKGEQAKIELDFNNGKKRLFAGDLDAVYPLRSALDSISAEGGFTYSVRNGKVENIGEVRGAWAVYKNGVRVEESLDSLIIEGGDHYAFRVEK